MSKDWNEEELSAASEAMKEAGHLGYEEFCEVMDNEPQAPYIDETGEDGPELIIPDQNEEPTEDKTANYTDEDFIKAAVEKIAAELKDFKGGNKESAVKTFIASTLTHFCEQEVRFAKAVLFTTRTLSDCCGEVMKGCGNSISDIDVYRAAVKHYFPNTEVHMKMEVHFTGADPTNEELTRPSTVKSAEPKPKKEKAKTESKPKPEKTSPVDYPAPKPEPAPEPEVMQLSMF